MQIVSRKDLNNLKINYASLIEENELLREELGNIKKALGLQETNGISEMTSKQTYEKEFDSIQVIEIEDEEAVVTSDCNEKQMVF